MGRISKELRRLVGQVGNVARYGHFNPFPRTKRKAKPKSLRDHPEWEIGSALEFIVAHLSRQQETPFFVLQIGAYDGNFVDPIAGLIRLHGWHGLLVEPQPEAFKQLRENYRDQPQLRFENAAVGTEDCLITIYSLKGADSHLASLDRHHLVRHGERSGDIIEHRVQCLTLHTLLARHGIEHVDLLQIDAEGNDGSILHSIDFTTFRPPIICYEHANLVEAERNACIELLGKQGYRILLEDSDTIAYRDPRLVLA